MLPAVTAAKLVAVMLTFAKVKHGSRGPTIARTSKLDAVRELHGRLRKTLPGPVELWGVKVAGRSAMAPSESALLSSFLRARSWDIDEAECMFTSSLRWRAEFRVDSLRASEFRGMPCEVFRGRDSRGRLLVVLRLSELRGDSFQDLDNFIRWRVYMQEALNSRLDFADGEPCYTLVLNCEGFTSGHFSKEARRCAKVLSQVSCDNYPDFLDKILICSPPPIFAFAFGVLRPFLPRNFVALIKMHSGDEASCLAEEQGRRRPRAAPGSRAKTAPA